MTDTLSAPVYRVRIAHSNTIKEGWRLAETTVECTFSGDADPDDIGHGLAYWADRIRAIGEREAEFRNTRSHDE